jgi:hypothetical protein
VQKNQLYYGDNLGVLREHIKDESVDLIYLDPPFNSRQDYNVLFAEKDGTRSSSQIMAFEDTWEWNMDAEATYQENRWSAAAAYASRPAPHSKRRRGRKHPSREQIPLGTGEIEEPFQPGARRKDIRPTTFRVAR